MRFGIKWNKINIMSYIIRYKPYFDSFELRLKFRSDWGNFFAFAYAHSN